MTEPYPRSVWCRRCRTMAEGPHTAGACADTLNRQLALAEQELVRKRQEFKKIDKRVRELKAERTRARRRKPDYVWPEFRDGYEWIRLSISWSP